MLGVVIVDLGFGEKNSLPYYTETCPTLQVAKFVNSKSQLLSFFFCVARSLWWNISKDSTSSENKFHLDPN